MSEFKEYEDWEASLDQNYLNQLRPDAFELSPDAFYAGQQSQQAKIDLLEVQLKGAEERAKLILDHKNKMVDELQKENDRLNIWYKNVKLQLENKQIDCDRSDREVDELQKKYDAMYNAFIVADDCRKEWHESYMSARKDRDELWAMVDATEKWIESNKKNIPLSEWHGYTTEEYVDADDLLDILKGNKDEN